MRSKINFFVLVGLLLFPAITAQAQFFSDNTVNIQFAPAKVPEEVTWSRSVSVKDDGLYSEKLPSNMTTEVWVQSQPIAAGMSWRPPTSTTIRLEVDAGAEDFTYLHAYVRYSCDRVHWSTWYNLQSQKTHVYESYLSVPRVAQQQYHAKRQEWWKTNPAWSSDEHELSLWIISQDPDFFSRELPFIGYVQVRIEGETRGLQLKSLSIKASSGVSGVSTLSQGRVRSTTGEKWFLDVSKIKR